MKRWTEFGAAALAVVMLLAALAQILFGLTGYPIIIATGVITALLSTPVIMNTARSPEITLEPDGLLLQSAVWRTRHVPYAGITAIKPDPSLPPAGAEVYRRNAVGRRNYRVAEGKLLIIPSLPLPFRLVGYFGGEGLKAAISINTRAHPDYDRLMPAIEQAWRAAQDGSPPDAPAET